MIVKVIHNTYGHETCKTLVASITLARITDHQEALEFAYMKTQNINDSWSKSEHPANVVDWRVKVEAPLHEEDGETFGLRSSMTGDFFQIIDNDYYFLPVEEVNKKLRLEEKGKKPFTGDSPKKVHYLINDYYVCATFGFDPCDPFGYHIRGRRLSDGEDWSYTVSAM